MSTPCFDTFFRHATGKEAPYDYQRRLACGERGDRTDSEWLQSGRDCIPQLINIPTGLGKTSAVVVAWLWNRLSAKASSDQPQWPRRLVYCLPMRTLVEQTRDEVKRWLAQLHAHADQLSLTKEAKSELSWLMDKSPVILMGGEDANDWDIYPEKAAILIGTQDMLLSRALNRGYGMSRYRWPMHFGLLNNDCLWVMDETQLMGVGVETSAQLAGFRKSEVIKTFATCPTWWMSATPDSGRLATVDHAMPKGGISIASLTETERTTGQPHKLINANKELSVAALALSSATRNTYSKQVAAFVKANHQIGTLTLVVVNRVARAREIFQCLTSGKKPLYKPESVGLIHSRFRPGDRNRHTRLLQSEGDRIIVATQAVEAGVDVSARLLITELAPWSSIVQRIGRCNRRAEYDNAQVRWIDIQYKDDKDPLLLPYTESELKKSRTALESVSQGSANALSAISVEEELVVRPVIRRRDLFDLFDTTPDICGQDLDVSRYIRDAEDSDVQLFWREIQENTPDRDSSPPERNELCRVSIGDAAKFFQKENVRVWKWNALDAIWDPVRKPCPGGVYLLPTDSGGYCNDLGWTGDTKDKPTPFQGEQRCGETYDGEPDTLSGKWQSLIEHTQHVVPLASSLATATLRDAHLVKVIETAALWHDLGKAHPAFQRMLRKGEPSRSTSIWAKSPDTFGKCERRGFRHELASALGWLLNGPADAVERDLVGFLIAAHHGKVRLSIRSLPGETGNPQNSDALFARGIWDNDILPEVNLGSVTVPETKLDLCYMRMGESQRGLSWLSRTVTLRDRLGPFRLAFLETLLRAADARASRSISN